MKLPPIIAENLCYKDPRNPYYFNWKDADEEPVKPEPGCACDNCFYRRTSLAHYAIELLKG